MTYSIRITDTRTGKPLGAGDGLTSAYAAGRMAADAYIALIARDGHDPARLELHGLVDELGEAREFTPAEQSAMVSALDQHIRELAGKS